MNRDVYIDTDTIKNNVTDLKKRVTTISEIFDRVNNNVDFTKKNDVWLGKAGANFYTKYDELSDNYETIIASLNTLVDFIEKISNSYEEFDKNVDKDVDNSDLDM